MYGSINDMGERNGLIGDLVNGVCLVKYKRNICDYF